MFLYIVLSYLVASWLLSWRSALAEPRKEERKFGVGIKRDMLRQQFDGEEPRPWCMGFPAADMVRAYDHCSPTQSLRSHFERLWPNDSETSHYTDRRQHDLNPWQKLQHFLHNLNRLNLTFFWYHAICVSKLHSFVINTPSYICTTNEGTNEGILDFNQVEYTHPNHDAPSVLKAHTNPNRMDKHLDLLF